MHELSYDFQNEQYIINYLKDEKHMSEEDIAEWLSVYKSLSVEDMSDLIYEIAGKFLFKDKPVDMKTFIHDPYFLGTIFGASLYKTWDDMLQEIYPAPFCKTCGEVVLSCATRCFGKGTGILMYDGTIKNIEDIKVGDLVMGDDSTPRTVLSLTHGEDDLYKIIPFKGESFICNKEHILPLRCTSSQERSTFYIKDKIDEISVKDYLNKPNHYKHMMKLYKAPVNFKKQENLTVDPYLYGLWLGDGHSNGTTLTSIDREIITIWEDHFIERGCEIKYRKCPNPEVKTMHVDKQEGNDLFSLYKESMSTGHKRIVLRYLTASREDRLKLLAGIIDTDGTLDKESKGFSVSTKFKDLAEDYAFLSRSLGFKTSLLTKRKKLKYKNNEIYTSYEVFISGHINVIPTILPRKQAKTDKYKVNPLNTGFKIEPIGKGEFFGFTTDGNHRFLLKDFTVQHNCGKTYSIVVSLLYELYLLLCMINPAEVTVGNPAETLVFAILSKDNSTAISQGASLFFKGLSASPYFQEQVPSNLPISNVEKKGVAVTDNILVKAGSSLATIIGTNLYAGCLDEANMPTTKIAIEKLVEVRMQIYNEMLDRHKSSFDKAPALSGILWMTSSPTDEGDAVGARIKQVQDKDLPNVMIKDNIARWETRGTTATSTFDFFLGSDTKDPCLLEDVPDLVLTEAERETRIIQVPRTIEYLNEFRNNPIHSIQNIAGRRTVAENSFFPSVSVFADVFKKENHIFKADELVIPLNSTISVDDYLIDKNYFKHPDRPDCYRYIHLDIASKRDRFGLSSVYSDSVKYTSEDGEEIRRRKYFIDFCLGICPLGKEPVDILKVLEFVYSLKKLGYPIKKVTTDSHQGELARQIIAKRGITTEYLSVEKTKEPYHNLKNLILTRSLEGFINPLLTKELHGLRESERKIEKSKGFTDDLSDSLAGALYSCSVDPYFRSTTEDTLDLITKFKQQQRAMNNINLNPYLNNKKFRF